MEENPKLLDELNSKFLKIDEEIYNKLSENNLYFICRIKKNDSLITNNNDNIIDINEKYKRAFFLLEGVI